MPDMRGGMGAQLGSERVRFRSADGLRERDVETLGEPRLRLFAGHAEFEPFEPLLRGVAEALDMDLVLLGHVSRLRYTAVAVYARQPAFALSEGTIIPIGETYCREEITADAPFVLGDAVADPRFVDHPGYVKHGLRSYAGAPVRLDDGRLYGTLCAVDVKPAAPTRHGVERLVEVAERVGRELSRRLRARS